MASCVISLGGVGCGADDSAATSSSAVPACDTTLAVFLDPAVGDADLRAAGSTLESVEGVVQVEVLEQAAALEEARRLFADDPSTLRLLDDARIPAYVKVQVVDGAAQQRAADVARDLPHVEQVKLPDAPAQTIIDVIGAEAAAAWCD